MSAKIEREDTTLQARPITFAATAAYALMLRNSELRTLIAINADTVNLITLGVSGSGGYTTIITIPPNTQTFVMRRTDFGDIINREIWCKAAAAITVNGIEVEDIAMR